MLPVFKPLPFSKIKRILKASPLSHITIHAGADPPQTLFPGTLNQSYQPDLPHGPVPRGRMEANLAPWIQAGYIGHSRAGPFQCHADAAARRSSQQRARTDVPTKRSRRRKAVVGSKPPSISVVPLVPASSSPCSRSQCISSVAPRPSVPLGHASLSASGTLTNLSVPWKRLGIIYNDGNEMRNYFKENGELNNCQHGSHEIDLVPE